MLAVQRSVMFPRDSRPPSVTRLCPAASLSACLFNSWDLVSDSEAQLQMFKWKQIPPIPVYVERELSTKSSSGEGT